MGDEARAREMIVISGVSSSRWKVGRSLGGSSNERYCKRKHCALLIPHPITAMAPSPILALLGLSEVAIPIRWIVSRSEPGQVV